MPHLNRALNVAAGAVPAQHVYRGDVHVWPNIEVPVGSVFAYPSETAPASWLVCNGGDCSAYPQLVAVLGSATLPDYRNRFILGDRHSARGAIGGKNRLDQELPLHNHNNSDNNIGWQNGPAQHNHSVSDGGAHTHQYPVRAQNYKDGNQSYYTRWVLDSNAREEVTGLGGDHGHYSAEGSTFHDHYHSSEGVEGSWWEPPNYSLVYIIKAQS